jgi:Ca-activated chloride channel family protein
MAFFALAGSSILFAQPAHADDSAVANLFLTADQQGRSHFERGEYEAAAAHFEDPLWRGVALYAAKRYEDAIDAFAAVDTADSWFNQANAYARLERYEEAVGAYDEALKRAPEHPDAAHNRKIVEAAWQKQKEKEDEKPAEGGSKLGADDYVVDEGGNKKKRPEGEETTFGGQMDEKMAEVWMRQVQTRPADFLRAKFAVQAGDARKEEDE